MSLDAYAGLKQSIQDHLDRDDLANFVDDFIVIAETRHRREIRIRQMLTRKSLTVIGRFTDFPTGYLEARTLRLLTDPVTVLTNLPLHEMNRRRSEKKGKPEFFTEHAKIEFDRVPDKAYSGEIIYYKSLTPISVANKSNALLARSPDVYLYSALAASAPFLMSDERISLWNGLYTNAKDSLNAMDVKRIGPLVSQVAGSTP